MEKLNIGKLGILGKVSMGRDEWWIIDELNNIIEKQNEIIDYLNSQDQQSNMKDWRGDLLKIRIIPGDMPDQTNFVLFNLDELNHFIKQLLLEREKEAVLKYILSLGWQDTDNEYVKEVLEDAERITSELSKLTTK